ncbi:MAG: ribosome small subunit-dependent GTPase A [Hyphomonadaceae bacterium]|nr:ribosome small subunit-dependent GTPase A [Hyphomonadaceae bacterium]
MLNRYGWSDALQQQFQIYATRDLSPARVIIQQRGHYVLATPIGEATAQLSGRFAHEAEPGAYPVAGDWVAATVRQQEASATIHHVLPRHGAFTRKAAGRGQAAQVVAANVDVALLVASLNANLNPRRIERYLATAWESGATPVVVLTKADLCHDGGARKAEIEAIALSVPVHVVSVVSGEGLEALGESFAPGQTAALLGSSGVGKSSLVNALAGVALMATKAIREEDARGRHATTHRQLVLLPNGRLVLDTPGMRELGLWDADAGVATTFTDVEALAAECRFNDCTHGTEPGCAIRAALADGTLAEDRWRSYGKLQRELAHLARKNDPRERAELRKVWIKRTRNYRAQKRQRMEDD